jgi:site-specific DNA recombinase
MRQGTTRASLTAAQIEQMITELADMAVTLRDADPDDKSELYQQLGLKLTYHPGRQLVRGAVDLTTTGHWFFDSVRGPTQPIAPYHAINYSAEVSL